MLQRQNTPTGHFTITDMLTLCHIDDLPGLKNKIRREFREQKVDFDEAEAC